MLLLLLLQTAQALTISADVARANLFAALAPVDRGFKATKDQRVEIDRQITWEVIEVEPNI